MNIKSNKKMISLVVLITFILTSAYPAIGLQLSYIEKDEKSYYSLSNELKYLELEITFSDPEIEEYGNYSVIRVKETNHNRFVLFNESPVVPVLPVNISIFELKFGSKIINIDYENSTAKEIDFEGNTPPLKVRMDSIYANSQVLSSNVKEKYPDPYPEDWVAYHTGGGLSFGKRTTFLSLRVYPVRYCSSLSKLRYINSISINITYKEPSNQIYPEISDIDLLVISPQKFKKDLQPLIDHKNKYNVKTALATTEYIYEHTWLGRDKAEKIKYFIKESIEKFNVKYVLLVGGLKGQRFSWYIPVRFSNTVPFEEQEYQEPDYLSDLYYADIYNGDGSFSSWDTNSNNIFAEWNDAGKDEVDNYPDVYLGRLACRNNFEVKVMVNKIVNYEKERVAEEEWFKNFILVAGDSYNDALGINEGETISEYAITKMPGFNPVRVYANDSTDINRETVNNAIDQGASFAYFCGHGSPGTWSTHFPPDGTEWTTGYMAHDMMFLKNEEKLPIVSVGGCHNGQFDVSILNLLKDFRYSRYHLTYTPNCWAWWLTSKVGGGAIACIANTGLGTHGESDQDNNSVADYIEVLDGWLEVRFHELYGIYGKDILGENHGETLTGYLNKFLGDEEKMDVKMVQQWELFGDPSLKIGGYE